MKTFEKPMAHAYYYRDTSILAAAVHLPPGISPGGVEKSLGFGLSEHERRGTIEIPCPSSSAECSIWIWLPRYGYIERYTMANDYSNAVADLERAKAAIARADVIAGCVRATRGKGPAELERALLAAGIVALTADEIARVGWRDPRTALRRAVAKLQRRLASGNHSDPHSAAGPTELEE